MAEKISFQLLSSDTSAWKEAVIVFTEGSFSKDYTKEERSYKVKSDAKYFDHMMTGNSLYGDCLDGSETVRLDRYLDDWTIDYCYITEK